jgi:hypothetical protein
MCDYSKGVLTAEGLESSKGTTGAAEEASETEDE